MKRRPYNAAPSSLRFKSLPYLAGWFYCHTWKDNIYVLWDVTADEVKHFIKRQFNLDYDPRPEAGGHCIEIEGEGNVIVVRRHEEGAPEEWRMGCLAHEAFHAAEHILSAREIRLTADTTEVYAHLIEEIVDRSLQIVNCRPRPAIRP